MLYTLGVCPATGAEMAFEELAIGGCTTAGRDLMVCTRYMLFEGLGWIGNFLFFVLSCWISVVLDLSLVLCEYMRDLLTKPLCILALL